MKLRWLLLFIFCAFPLASSAEIFAENSGITGNGYFGVHLSGLRYEESTFNFHEPAGGFRLGYEFADHFGVEGQLATGLHDDSEAGVSYGVDYLVGAYVRGSIFLWDPRARLHALAGVTRGKTSTTSLGLTTTETHTEPSFGLGLELYADSRNGFSFEFMRYLDGENDGGDNFNIDTFNLGYIHRF